jgi:hypothetical protein
MSADVSDAFIAKYLSEVHEAYQQKGSKLRNCVRLKTGIEGSTAIFQVAGKGSAGLKTRHGNVPLMNVLHSSVTATLQDWYAADYVDKLDELKTNIDERMVQTNAGAFALGRKVDSLITTVLDSGAGTTDTTVTLGLSKTRILTAFQTLNAADVPDDGNRWAVVGPHQWNELLNLAEFKSSDYVGNIYPWLNGTESRKWLGINWMMHSGLPAAAANVTKCFIWHQSAVGLAEGTDLKLFVDWVPEKAAHLIDHMISAGAVTIDSTGIYEIQCDDLEAIT